MKKTTKALLMAALCMVIVGSAFCIAGACFGFTFAEFIEAVEAGQLELELPFNMSGEQETSMESVLVEGGSGESIPAEASVGTEDAAAGVPLTETSAAGTYGGIEAEYQESFENIDSLDLDLGVSQCSIILWEEEEFLVTGSDLPDAFSCRKDGRELEIDCGEDEWRFWEDQAETVLNIYVPKNQLLEKVVIEAGVGEIAVLDGYLACEELRLDSGVGECRIRADIQKKIEIDGGIGSVELELKGKMTDFNYDLDNGIGEAVIGDLHLKDLGVDEQIDHNADKEVSIDNGIGNITVRFSEE